MHKIYRKLFFVFILIFSLFSKANIIGTEYQNFNPTLTGFDFTTVQSSQTLKPCFCNLGLFFNYAKNTLTYSDKYYQTNTDLKGKRVNDYLVGGDLNLAIGLSDNWDFGVGLPYTIASKNEDPYGVTYFDRFGITEVRPLTKYRFYGDDAGGLAVVVSANFNTIDNNPFSGEKPGATFNLELVGDTTTSGGYKFAGNIGYRKRNPGKQITDPVTGNPAPFVPFKDSFIMSAAVAKNVESIKTDFLAELNASRTGKLNEDDSIRKSQEALELGLGLRHEWSQALNLHAGAGTKLLDAQASPDVRIYAGLNYQFGPVCPKSEPKREQPVEKKAAVIPANYPHAVVLDHPSGNSDQVDLKMPVTAEDPNDYQAYRWKLGPSAETDCTVDAGYSQPTPGLKPIKTFVGEYPDGPMTLCAVARNLKGDWQPYSDPTIVKWNKKLGYELFRLNAAVLFDFDKDTLQKRAYGELDKIARHLRTKPFVKCLIEGHTDAMGSVQYNLDLSKRRAKRVQNHLVEQYEFDPTILPYVGKGKGFPVDTNKTDEGRANNRRVEFKIYRK